MSLRWSARLIALCAAVLLVAGCSGLASGGEPVEEEPPADIQSVAEGLRGSLREVSVSVDNQGVCGPGDVLFVEVQQSAAAGEEGFNATTTHNVIKLLEAIKEGDREFALDYKAFTSGVDRYGNSVDDDIHWLCYKARDVRSINLGNRSYLESNVLSMNSFGQNDVGRFFRGHP